MKVSISWLKELVNIQMPADSLISLINLRTIGTKEVTEDFIELDMKGYNRADLLSMKGVAKEVAAIADTNITFEEVDTYIWEKQQLASLNVEVKNSELAPVYCLAKIENLKVGDSPQEWTKKLQDCGMRSIDNITDVTNLVMLEYGQPLHAFDAQKVSSETIIVRCANEDEEFVTLDNKKRKLTVSDLMIADPQKSLGIAGVMGGKNSEVSQYTTTILLEAAIFDPANIRKTAQRLALPSEASRRFQHGLTKKNLLLALNKAISMYQQMGGTLTGITLIGDFEDREKVIHLSFRKTKKLIGIDISQSDIESYLKRLGFKLAKKEDGWEVTPPYYRLDIDIEEDVIEEIARMYGYEKIPSKELVGKKPEPIDQSLQTFIKDTTEILINLGLTEVQTYSFYSSDSVKNLELDKSRLYRVANPISTETEYLRSQIWPNLLTVIAENLKFYDEVAIFEIGRTYNQQNNFVPEEKTVLSIAVSNDTDEPYQETYAIVRKLFEKIGREIVAVKPEEEKEKMEFHPTKYWLLKSNSKFIGNLAEVHPKVALKYGTEKRVAIAEILMTTLI